MPVGLNGAIEPGNLMVASPYYIAGKSSITVPAAGARLATLVNFGRIDPDTVGIRNVPIRLTRALIAVSLVSGATRTTTLELVKGTATVQDNANGTERVAVRRKTQGYPAIASNEVSLYMSTAGTAVSGGNFAAVGEPFHYSGAGSAATFEFNGGLWMPADLVPTTLEVGEAVAVQVTDQGGAAVAIVGLCFDFLRQ